MKKDRNQRMKLILAICVLVIAICTIGIALLFGMPKKEPKAVPKKSVAEKTKKAPASESKSIDWTGLQQLNPDVYAWIEVPGTRVNYPVLQSSGDEEEDYYLKHNVDHSAGYPGAIYSQKVNAKDFTDRMTVLYGHNMKNGTMFQSLHSYSDKKFMQEHPYAYIYTPDKTYIYQIFAAYNYDDRLILPYFNYFQDDDTWNSYLDSFKELYDGTVDSDVKLESDDKLLTLSTCNSDPDERFLVQGVLLTDDEASNAGVSDNADVQTKAAKAAEEIVSKSK